MTRQLTHPSSNTPNQQSIITDYGHDPFRLRIAAGADEQQIDALRQAAYATAGYLSIPDPQSVTRRTDPAESLCLIIANRTTVAATVRVAYAQNQPTTEAVLQGPVPLGRDHFPTATLCRGATNAKFRRQGLMVFLVGVGVAIAKQAGLASATGMQVLGTPHYGAMLKSGWQSRDVHTDHVVSIRIDGPQMKLVHIGADRFHLSENYGRRHFSALHKSLNASPIVKEASTQIVQAARQHL